MTEIITNQQPVEGSFMENIETKEQFIDYMCESKDAALLLLSCFVAVNPKVPDSLKETHWGLLNYEGIDPFVVFEHFKSLK